MKEKKREFSYNKRRCFVISVRIEAWRVFALRWFLAAKAARRNCFQYFFLEIILISFNSPVCLFTRTLLFVNLVGFLVSLPPCKMAASLVLPVSFLSCVRLVVNGLVYLKGGHCAPRRVRNSTNKKKREREKDLDVRSSSPIFHHQPMTADSIHADLFLSILFFFFSSLCWKQQIEKGPQGSFFFPCAAVAFCWLLRSDVADRTWIQHAAGGGTVSHWPLCVALQTIRGGCQKQKAEPPGKVGCNNK